MLGLYLKIFFALNRAAGLSWPFLLIAGLIRSKGIFKATRWADNADSAESRYVKRLSIASALYLILAEKKGEERAHSLMQDILVSFGRITVRKRFHSVNLARLSGMERLMAFNNYMTGQDEAKHNNREYLVRDEKTCHYIIKRCVVFDFFSEAGTPGLTRFICEVDQYFFPRAFVDFEFDRGDSWENTIAYGKPHCDFTLRLKD